jgi:hypothetical protein
MGCGQYRGSGEITLSMISQYLLLPQSHCDFTPLQHLLLATNMQDMKEVTHATHYQNFRRHKLGAMMEQEVGILSIALVIIFFKLL